MKFSKCSNFQDIWNNAPNNFHDAPVSWSQPSLARHNHVHELSAQTIALSLSLSLSEQQQLSPRNYRVETTQKNKPGTLSQPD